MHTISINNITEGTSQQQTAERVFEPHSLISFTTLSSVPATVSNLCCKRLSDENKLFAGTLGLSQNNAEYGFCPAFRNEKTKQVLLSRTANGKVSPVHLLEGLPQNWFFPNTQDDQARVLLDEITSGFVRQGIFYTREETINAIKIFNLDDE
ncbi:hypothetical protein [Alkalimarinus coralli]|uniref:hypothetical protein n=1 Tax=Alkalimarinus coralli TaxID=2935863 RepID=UPI00202B7A30|nr:hypothetical protein [Alkalimarinus coralli]